MRRLFRQGARLFRLVLSGPGGKLGILIYAAILALEFADILVTLRLISWTKDFYDALQQMDAAGALRQVGIFAMIVVAAVSLYLSSTFLTKRLEIRWRKALTSQILDRWLANGAYLRTRGQADGGGLDNPDQRISEDCRIFLAGPANDHGSATGLIPLSISLVTRVVALFSYVALLWSLSTFPLDLSFIGIDGELPRYMVWAAFVYVALSTGVTHLLGRPLKPLYANQQRREADYRFALVRVRENADAVALSAGEASERTEIDRRFGGIMENWRRIVGREIMLSSFTYPYRFTVMRVPTFLALPAYFAGSVTFGGLMQMGNAFAQVATTLSWFIFAYRSLAELAAATGRLGDFLETLDPEDGAPAIRRSAGGPGFAVSGLALRTPAGRPLAVVPDMAVEAGDTVWIKGPSGIGKTVFMKAAAGLWRDGSGEVAMPDGRAMFLPQQPYLPIGDLAAAVAYPAAPDAFTAAETARALDAVGLAHLAQGEGADRPVLNGLSGGERQRIALARLFLHRPDWIFLDEATGALDAASETALLRRLRQALPDAALVIVAHRRPEVGAFLRVIEFSDREAAVAAE